MDTFIFKHRPSTSKQAIRWQQLEDQYIFPGRMADCPQEPRYHGEGDVWTHTRMVVEEVCDSPAWGQADAPTRDVLFGAALLHDVGKPDRTRETDEGRITSRGHSRRGAVLARKLMWEAGVDFSLRERICQLIRFHQIPFFLLDRDDAGRLIRKLSLSVSLSELTTLARADARGRIAPDQQELLENVSLVKEFAQQHDCWSRPFDFPSAHSRFQYFRRPDRNPYYPAHEAPVCEAVLMSGLPASGKDFWIHRNLGGHEVISLDDIRGQMGISPADNQGPVIQRARQQAKEYLREGVDFVWNATGLSRRQRSKQLNLFGRYRARTRVVYVETSPDKMHQRNQDRERPVPGIAIESMQEKWELPTLEEAHQVEYWIQGQNREGWLDD